MTKTSTGCALKPRHDKRHRFSQERGQHDGRTVTLRCSRCQMVARDVPLSLVSGGYNKSLTIARN